MKEVLLIDDNPSDDNPSAFELMNFLQDKGYSLIIVDNVDEGLENIKKSKNLKVVLLNVELSAISGLSTLQQIKLMHPEVIVIAIGTEIQTARKVMSFGALDVVSKHTNMEQRIHNVLDQVFEQLSIRSKTSLTPTVEMPLDQYFLVGESEIMFELHKAIERVAASNVSVLIEGETGTEKGLVARLIHRESKRENGPFITINCGAVPEGFVEVELFGYEAGAYTNARPEGQPGKLELADGGTLFLHEIGDMPPSLQMALLNVLQTGEVRRMGGTRVRNVDVRVISATNQKLAKIVEQEAFRLDLFHLLCGYRILIPPLRERKEDISRLLMSFLHRIHEEGGKLIHGFDLEVMKLLERYNWPGNVRELENCLRHAVINSPGEGIGPQDLPEAIRMYRGEGSIPEMPVKNLQTMQSSKTPVAAPMYRHLFDLPVVVFCQFISDAKSGVTDNQIDQWWVEFCDDGLYRANIAKREIDDWWLKWHTNWFSPPDFSRDIKKVIDDAISQLSNLRREVDSTPIAEAEPISIVGKTLKGSITAVLHEIIKTHGGDKQKAAKELGIPVQQLRRWTENDGNDKIDALQTPVQSSRRLERFLYEETLRLLTEPIHFFILEIFSRREWRDKSLNDQIRTVHLALKVLSKRLAGDHGCIYFGGMTFSQIEENIYRRAPYIYTNLAEAAAALGVDVRTFKRYWPEDKVFPSHYTLFTG